MISIISFLLGLLVENASEWLIHKYILHGLGKHKDSIWAYHWYDHHAVCFKNGMIDEGYRQLKWQWNTQTKELLGLLVIMLSQLPLIGFAFWYVMGFYFAIACYYYRHRKAHLDADWARTHLFWHYQHHLGKNPESNWCITWPWFDYLMKTRQK